MNELSSALPIGSLVKLWRERRRMTQLFLATEADISNRHLSFIETGRASPSRAMVLRLADHLDVPLRERNRLLTSAGFAPLFAERSLDDASMQPARVAMDHMLKAQEPYPALAIDRHWTMLAANGALGALLDDIDPALLVPPVNVLRLSLHPRGLAPRIANLGQWRAHLLERLRRQIEASGDQKLIALRDELLSYPNDNDPPAHEAVDAGIAVPFVLTTQNGLRSFLSTTVVFGTPVDITLSELAIELFFPADEITRAAFKR